MLARIEVDNAGRSKRETALVFLGDLIDRGPDSRGVIERLSERAPTFCRTLFVKGNHEEALVTGLRGAPQVLARWLSTGGYECAQSYGVPVGDLFGAQKDQIAARIAPYIPKSHLDFMDGFLDSVRFGDYLFVHAGVRPGVPLERQGRELRWIRDDFVNSEADFGFVVVHGHTISDQAVFRPNRIGIDTGAYRTGRMTALRLEGGAQEILEVVGAPGPDYSHAR